MRKTLFAVLALAGVSIANAQITLHDNGPMVTHAGQGSGGADVSMCSLDPNTAGLNRKFFGPDAEYFSTADDFTLSANATLTSVVLYGYETNANTPTWTGFTVNLWQGQPGAGGNIIATATSVTFAQTNIFRVFNGVANLGNVARKINAITANFADIPLTSGTTYWVSCQITAGGASGWANMVMDINPADPNNPITRAGNGLQYRTDATTGLNGWYPAVSGTTNIVQSEFPMLIKGNPATSTETLAPTAEQFVRGQGIAGTLASWAADDNDPRNVRKFIVINQTEAFIRVNLDYTTTKANPTAISFVSKARMLDGGVFRISMSLRNDANAFVEVLPETAIGLSFATFTGNATGTMLDYVQAAGAMRGQIAVRQAGPSTAILPRSSFETGNMVVTG